MLKIKKGSFVYRMAYFWGAGFKMKYGIENLCQLVRRFILGLCVFIASVHIVIGMILSAIITMITFEFPYRPDEINYLTSWILVGHIGNVMGLFLLGCLIFLLCVGICIEGGEKLKQIHAPKMQNSKYLSIFGVFKQWLKAKKEKICPIVEVEE